MPTRRIITAGLATLALGGCDAKVVKAVSGAKDLAKRMADIETRHGGRLGVSAITAAGAGREGFNIRADQRFAHCSTFKWVLATAVLHSVDQGRLSLSQNITYGPKDLLSYAPVTKAHVGDGHMSIGDLCAAAVELSDNTAANLLLAQIGGPAGLTTFVRGLGDTVTRFDRTEPDLNSNIADDPRDTTTPAAMAHLLKTVFTGTVLTPASLAQLKAWMVACSTGLKRIRAGVPAGAIVADKTGTGDNGAANDVAVVWPPKEPPVFLAIYTSGGHLDGDGRNQVIADLTRLAFDALDYVGALKP